MSIFDWADEVNNTHRPDGGVIGKPRLNEANVAACVDWMRRTARIMTGKPIHYGTPLAAETERALPVVTPRHRDEATS